MRLHAEGKSRTQIARDTGVPRTTVRRWVNTTPTPSTDAPAVQKPGERSVVAEPVRAYAPIEGVTYGRVDACTSNTVLLYGDTHFPHQDDAALSIVHAIAETLQPDTIVHMGDLLDCYELGRFDRDPKHKTDTQAEIDMARAHLAAMREVSPNSEFWLLEGNHLDRLRKTLWGLPGTAAALSRITALQQALTWRRLLGLDELNIQFMPYADEHPSEILNGMFIKHGSLVRTQSAYSARGEMERAGMSGASGHTHRLGSHYQTTATRSHLWIETGCTCSMTPEYVQHPNWQQGCVVLSPGVGSLPTVEIVNIRDGVAHFRGEVWRG